MSFTFTVETHQWHADDSVKRAKPAFVVGPPPEAFDWRAYAHLAPLPCHNKPFPSGALIMATQCLQDRWAIWHKCDAPASLSVPYIANTTRAHGIETTTLENAWLALQQHGTVDRRREGYRARHVYGLASEISNIRRDIYSHGPLTAVMHVDETFAMEKCSVTPYTPPLNESAVVARVVVTVVGWGRNCWIVGTAHGPQSFATDTEYGSNGYVLVEANGQLEKTCMAAFPFYRYCGVKQPPCCRYEFQQHYNLGIHGPVHVLLYRNVKYTPSANIGADVFVPLPLVHGKRCKKPSPFTPSIKLDTVRREPLKDPLSTIRWTDAARSQKGSAPVAFQTPCLQQVDPVASFSFHSAAAVAVAECRRQPGEVVVVCLLIVAVVLACVAACRR